MTMRMWHGVLAVLGVLACGSVVAEEEEYESRQWREIEIRLPAPPRQESLLPFYVTATTENRAFIDSASLAVDADGVVRYVMLILTPQGIRNVTFEGMRCETRERRIYASGRPDGTWSKSRNEAWMPIRNVNTNRYHAVLFANYFCPDGLIVGSADEARNALKQDGHPDVRR